MVAAAEVSKGNEEVEAEIRGDDQTSTYLQLVAVNVSRDSLYYRQHAGQSVRDGSEGPENAYSVTAFRRSGKTEGKSQHHCSRTSIIVCFEVKRYSSDSRQQRASHDARPVLR